MCYVVTAVHEQDFIILINETPNKGRPGKDGHVVTVIFRPSKKTDPRDVYASMHCGIPNAYKFLLQGCEVHKLVYIEPFCVTVLA